MKRLSFAVLVLLSVLLAQLAQGATGPVVISEFMAANSSALVDDFGENSDWIEIYNGSSSPVNLLNWGLTDADKDNSFDSTIADLSLKMNYTFRF